MNDQEHIRWHQERDRQLFTQHELLDEQYWNSGRSACWLIGRPDRSEFRCEILAGTLGSLVVHGDFASCRFAYYGDTGDAWNRLLWMADCKDLSYYVRQKATIGERRCAEDVYEMDGAREDILQYIREIREGEGGHRDEVRVLVEAARHYTESREELMGFLYEEGHRWELHHHGFGMRMNPTLIVNHCALVKCAELLRQRHGDRGPRACWEGLVDELNVEVTIAITEAEREQEGTPGYARAWRRVERAERCLAAALPSGDVEQEIALRGAIMAAEKAAP